MASTHRAYVADALLGRAHVREEQPEHALVANLVDRVRRVLEPVAERGPAGVGELVDGPGAAAGRLGLSGDQPFLFEAPELWVDLAVARRPEEACRLVDELLDVVAGLSTELIIPRITRPVGVKGVGGIQRGNISARHMAVRYIVPSYLSIEKRFETLGVDVSGRAGQTSPGARDGHLGAACITRN